MLDSYDHGSIRRGFQVYQQVCDILGGGGWLRCCEERRGTQTIFIAAAAREQSHTPWLRSCGTSA